MKGKGFVQEEVSDDEAEGSLDSVMEDAVTLDVSFGDDDGVETPTTDPTSEQARQSLHMSKKDTKQILQKSKSNVAQKEKASELILMAGSKRLLSRKNG